MPKITSRGPSYDPAGPFTGNPHDDRPETVIKAPASEVVEEAEVVEPDTDVPSTKDGLLAWCVAPDDRIERARRIGRALEIERAKAAPRVTVIRELEARQDDLSA